MSPSPVFLEMNFIRTLSGRNAIQIKIPVGTFMGLDKLTLKAEPTKPDTGRKYSRERGRGKELILLDAKTSKARISQTLWYGHRWRWADQRNRTRSLQSDAHVYGHLLFENPNCRALGKKKKKMFFPSKWTST